VSAKKKQGPTVPHWRQAANAIPSIVLFDEDGKRNARLALQDPKTRPNLRAELKRYLENPAHAAAVDQQKLLTEAAKDFDATERRGAPFRKGGAKGRINKRSREVRAHIRELQDKHSKLTPPQLFKKADRYIIGDMAEKTFCDHARAARQK
jgi:hypothetical protein